MTDRYNALTVILDEDIRDEDAEALINAIKQLRHVLDVKPHIATFGDQIAESRVRSDLAQKLFKVIYPELGRED